MSSALPSVDWDLPAEFDDVPVVLTAHPFQRVGAFVLASLAGVESLEELSWKAFATGPWAEITQPLLDVAELSDAKQPGGFWLAASYMLWPNSKMNTTNRKKLSVQQRQEATLGWRTLPPPEDWPDVPCALCSRPACGFYGKVDVPLAASTEYRNTTVPGHDGLALCVGCLGSFYALPWGCLVHRGRLSLVHSWDDEFLRDTVADQVAETRRQSWSLPSGGYEREQLLLERVRGYSRPLRADVSLMVFTNSNKEQEFVEYRMRQPLTAWLKRSQLSRKRRQTLVVLERSLAVKSLSGRAVLARELLQRPERLPRLIANVLHQRAESHRAANTPAKSGDFFELLSTYCLEVLRMSDQLVRQLEDVGDRAAYIIEKRSEPLTKFVVAYRRPRDFRKWLEKAAVTWLNSATETKRTDAFVSARLMRALFEYSDEAWLNRQTLFVAVLAKLQERGYATDLEDAEGAEDAIEQNPTDEDD